MKLQRVVELLLLLLLIPPPSSTSSLIFSPTFFFYLYLYFLLLLPPPPQYPCFHINMYKLSVTINIQFLDYAKLFSSHFGFGQSENFRLLLNLYISPVCGLIVSYSRCLFALITMTTMWNPRKNIFKQVLLLDKNGWLGVFWC